MFNKFIPVTIYVYMYAGKERVVACCDKKKY